MSIKLKKKTSAEVPIPESGYATLFINESDGFNIKLSTGDLINFNPSLSVAATVSINTTVAVGTVQFVDVSSNDVTITLPSTHSASDQLVVKLTSAATYMCTVEPAVGDLINGTSSVPLLTDGESIWLISDGTDWYQIS